MLLYDPIEPNERHVWKGDLGFGTQWGRRYLHDFSLVLHIGGLTMVLEVICKYLYFLLLSLKDHKQCNIATTPITNLYNFGLLAKSFYLSDVLAYFRIG